MTTEILILSLLFLFVINTPIAISIGMASILAMLIKGDFPLMMVVQRMFGGIDSFHLMAVPLFMFVGKIWRVGLMGHTSRRRNVVLFLSVLETVLKAEHVNIQSGAFEAVAAVYEEK